MARKIKLLSTYGPEGKIMNFKLLCFLFRMLDLSQISSKFLYSEKRFQELSGRNMEELVAVVGGPALGGNHTIINFGEDTYISILWEES